MLGGHDRSHSADAEEVPPVVHVRDQVEIGDRLAHDAFGAHHAGIGDEHVDATVDRGRGCDRRQLGVGVGDVHLDGNRAAGAVLLAQLGSVLPCQVDVQVGQYHLGALGQ